MEAKTVKRIDSLYRNIKSFLMLMILSIFVPILLLFSVPLSFAYLYLRSRLLRDIASGKITIDDGEVRQSMDARELTTAQKVEFIRQNSARLWVPAIVFFCITVTILLVVVST